MIAGRIARRLLDAPRTRPEEVALQPELDALGGEVVRFRSRDGLRLSARWLEAASGDAASGDAASGDAASGDPAWTPDPREAIVLLHGWSGSVAPDLVEYGPSLRRTAGVLGLDLRGHGASDPSATTFGLREVDDVGGALAWLGERGIRRVALVGTSMGGVVAIAATVVLGDGRLRSVDVEPDAARITSPAPRPAIVGIVAEAVPAELPTVVASRLPGPGPIRRWLARRAFAIAAERLGGDPRDTEPIRVVGLLEDLPLLLIHGAADATVPPADGRRIAAAAGPGAEAWTVAGADHSLARRVGPEAWDRRVGSFLRGAFEAGREREVALGILGSPAANVSGASDRPLPEEADQQA
ncbi:MAG TPA: alpha/beta hydrolase [Candidatus Limnocylindrales bacterium]|nr:alpha/beta hydrolase [Candidatus Limnocylindrales bacterium]